MGNCIVKYYVVEKSENNYISEKRNHRDHYKPHKSQLLGKKSKLLDFQSQGSLKWLIYG